MPCLMRFCDSKTGKGREGGGAGERVNEEDGGVKEGAPLPRPGSPPALSSGPPAETAI